LFRSGILAHSGLDDAGGDHRITNSAGAMEFKDVAGLATANAIGVDREGKTW